MLKKLVVIPGGFHPFHAGHKALYDAAVEAFPRADVYIAATDDQAARPFPFKLKQQLAQIAGIPKHRFIQVKSPFRPQEITQHYDPADTQLIFVRSDKDSGVTPLPGGVKKDGSRAYLQPLNRRNPEPMTQHGFMTYLPTVSFGPGMSSATEIRAKWPTMSDGERTNLVKSLYGDSSPAIVNKAKEIFSTVLGDKTLATVDETIIVNKGDTVDILPKGGMGTHSETSLQNNLGNKLRSLADMLDSGKYEELEYHIYQSGVMQSMIEALAQYKRFKDKRGNRPVKQDVEIDISNEEQQVDENPLAYAALRGAGHIASKMNPANTGMVGSALSGVAAGIAKAAGADKSPSSSHTVGSARTGSGYVSPGDEKNALDAMAVEDYLPEEELVEYVYQSKPLRVLDNISSRKDKQAFPIKFDDGTTVEVTPKVAEKFMSLFLRQSPEVQQDIDKRITQKRHFLKTFNMLMKDGPKTTLVVKD